MCKQLVYYPLVRNKLSDKKKILFRQGIPISNRNDLLNVSQLRNNLINNYTKYDVDMEFVKMVSVPCGCCSECLANRARQWAFRIVKEAQQFDENYFVTLTYDEEHIPSDHMISKKELSDFNKKLRTYLKREGVKEEFRFYGVGEYGGQTARPHYHVIYFNLPLNDLKYSHTTDKGHLVFTSDFLNKVWSKGFVVIEEVSIGSACYVARYVDKKQRLNKTQKEQLKLRGITPEFSLMSRNPGIGAYYLDDIIEKFKEGKYTEFINGKEYSLSYSQYYTSKIKSLLPLDVLEKYESSSKMSSNAKVARQMTLSDFIPLGDLISNDRISYKNKRKN